MSRYLKTQQKLIDAAFAGERPAAPRPGARARAGAKQGALKASARRKALR
jgi:hypothetical protein